MKRVYLIHGWNGAPDEGWRPWLQSELKQREFTVFNLSMPSPAYPKQHEWVEHMQQEIGVPDEETYLVGHSLGSVAILRYLEALGVSERIGGAILVAGFTDDLGIEALSNFFLTPLHWEKIQRAAETFVSIQSDNDPYNLQIYNEEFKKYLNAEIFVEHDKKHFSGNDGVIELPIAFETLLKIANREKKK